MSKAGELQRAELQQWVQRSLEQHVEIVCDQPLQLSPLTGDAGLRCYFRVNTTPSLLAVMAPPDAGASESGTLFATLATALREQGIPTPQIVALDAERNFLLVEDFGGDDFLDVLQAGREQGDGSADMLYGEALMVLLRLQQVPRSAVSVPDYDSGLLMQELSLFDQWFVADLLGHTATAEAQALLDDLFGFLVQQALSQPQVLVHRDFHSRNLLYREGEAPGVIDFQDAVWGPITYDLVSLLKDCYIQWSPEQVKRWLMTYGNMAIELEVMTAINPEQWQQWFDMAGLQRHLKVLGIFARLYLRDGKPRYLADLPRVWGYVLSVARQYPETQAFYRWAQTHLQPLVEQQAWYQQQIETASEALL